VRRFNSIQVHTTHFSQHTEITLQGILNRVYTLRLFEENVERALQRKDNRTWTLARHLYVHYLPTTYTHQRTCICRGVSPTSQIRAEVQTKSGHWFWARYREASEVIDLHELFNDYWSSVNHEFTVLSQSLSPTTSRISDSEGQRLLPLESIVTL
jgi:hypothetical protein